MTITTNWYNEEKTIIHHIYSPRWSWDDLYQALDEATRMIDTVDHIVDLIIDMRGSTVVPSNVFTHGKHALATSHPRRGYMIVVGAPRLIQTLYDAFTKVYSKGAKDIPTIFATTLDDAVAHAHRSRQTETPSQH